MPAQLWVSVIELSCFAGLLGLGYFLVLRGADVFMFALGSLAMFSAMIGAYLATVNGWPWPVAVLLGIGVSVLTSVVTEVTIVQPIRFRTGGDELTAIVALVAIIFALGQLSGTLFGRTPLPGLEFWSHAFDIDGALVAGRSVILLIVTVISFVSVSLWMRYSPSGRMLRAVGDNEHAARMIGVPVQRIRITAFGIAGLLAGLAGTLFAGKAGVVFTSGLDWTLVGFLAVIVGGLGRVWAPIIGALIVAVVETWIAYKFGNEVVEYAIVIVALVFFAFRPQGIFQMKVRV